MNIAHIKYLWKRDFTKSNKSLNKGSAPFIYAMLEKLPPLGILACCGRRERGINPGYKNSGREKCGAMNISSGARIISFVEIP